MKQSQNLKSHALDELTDAQLHCRLYGHAWDDAPLIEDRIGNLRVRRQTNTCESCGLIRADILDDNEEVWSRRYDYTKTAGYQLSFKTDVRDLRQERYRRQVAGQYNREKVTR